MFDALNQRYWNGGGYDDVLDSSTTRLNMPDLGPQAHVPEYVPRSILAMTINDEHIYSRRDIVYPGPCEGHMPAGQYWFLEMPHERSDQVRTHPCNLWHCSIWIFISTGEVIAPLNMRTSRRRGCKQKLGMRRQYRISLPSPDLHLLHSSPPSSPGPRPRPHHTPRMASMVWPTTWVVVPLLVGLP